MTELPSSIEAYLVEAKFSSTEILILRKLLEGQALSLRDIGGKTGKSPGVLDQAMKKLVEKHIVKRELVNGTPKFVLSSLDAVAHWIKEDMRKKREVMKRKQEDFESFIASLKADHNKPEIHYFEGEEGMKKAYMELLKHGKEILYYKPMMEKEEDDPLRPFFVDWFRARHRTGVHLKVLAQNTPLGRRYQSRDAFEYRETVLVPHEQFTFDFEKVIVGDIVACINRQEQKASFIHYKEIASTERNLFHMLWMLEKSRKHPEQAATEIRKEEPEFGLSTKAASALREFFLSRKSIAVLVFLGIVAAGLTYGLYERAVYVNTQRVRERAMGIVATGALQFKAADIEKIHNISDVKKPEYAKIVKTLQDIRQQNPDVVYAYIMRPTKDPFTLKFVADADSLDPDKKEDLNGDGIINDADALNVPGETYNISDEDLGGFENALIQPNADLHPYTDQWGTFISAAAPIRNNIGDGIAIFGVDLEASDVQKLTQETMNPFLVFCLLFIAFVLFRLAAFDRSLMKEILELLKTKKVIASIVVYVVFAGGLTVALYEYDQSVNLMRAKDLIQSIAVTGALQLDAKDVEQLQVQDDWKKPEWAKVVHILERIRKGNPNILYVYILRKNPDDPNHIEFVSDSHSLNPFANSDDDPTNDVDVVFEGKDAGVPDTPESNTLAWPGQPYDDAPLDDVVRGYEEPTTTEDFYKDTWGVQISAYVPIHDAHGKTVAVLAIDMSKPQVKSLGTSIVALLATTIFLLVMFVLLRPSKFKESLLRDIFRVLLSKQVLLPMLLCGCIALALTYVMYRHTLRLMHDEVGTRLMSIVSTAAPHIDSHDLEKLMTPNDLQSPEYERVFSQLNQIRNQNTGIQFVWILRPTKDEKVWQWVADADSSKELGPFTDENGDGIMQPEEQNVYPSEAYPLTTHEKNISKGLLEPTFEEGFVSDQWGTYVTAYAPIKDAHGKGIAVLGVDMNISDFKNAVRERFSPLAWSLLVLIITAGFLFSFVSINKLVQIR